MRKFTLIIVSLLLTMSAMAQITDVSELSNNKCYHITSKDSQRGAMYAAEGATYLSGCGGTYSNYPNRDVSVDNKSTKQQFALIKYQDKLYLYSVSEKKFTQRVKVNNEDGLIMFNDKPSHYVTVENNGAYFNIKVNGNNRLNFSNKYSTAGIHANYDTNDDGNNLVITEAGDFNPEEALKILSSTKYISVYTGNFYQNDNTQDAQNATDKWTNKWISSSQPQITLKTKNGNNNIQNKNNAIVLAGGSADPKTTTYEISIPEGYKITGYSFNYTKATTNNTEYTATIIINETEYTVDTSTQELNISGLETNTTEFTITDQNKGVLVTEFYVYYKDLKEEARNELQRKIEQIIAWDQIFEIIGPAVGQLSSTNENFSYDLWDIMAFYSDESENATIEEIEEKIAEIEALTETLKRNMPVDGKAYVFVNVTSEGEKSYLNWNGEKIVAINNEETKPMTAAFICRKLDNGKYVFVNNAGKYLTFQCDETKFCPDGRGNGYLDNYDTSNNKYCDWTITYGDLDNDHQRRAMLLEVQAKGKINYLLHKYSTHTFHSAGQGDKFNDGNLSSYWILEDFTYANTPRLNSVGTSSLLTPDLHNKAMATFSAPFPTVLPDGVTAYYATEDKGDYVSIKPFESRTIPANTGVILVGEEAGNVTMVPAAGETPEAISNNLLSHSAGADLTFTTGYILSAMNGEAGFYKARAYGSSQHLAMNKAYIAIDAIQNSVNLRLFGTTSIENIEVENEDTAIYDLTGRRISEIAKPGIYIINGKKVTVK